MEDTGGPYTNSCRQVLTCVQQCGAEHVQVQSEMSVLCVLLTQCAGTCLLGRDKP